MSKAMGTNRTHRDIFVWCRHDHVAKRELPVGYVNAPVVLVDLVCGPQATNLHNDKDEQDAQNPSVQCLFFFCSCCAKSISPVFVLFLFVLRVVVSIESAACADSAS